MKKIGVLVVDDSRSMRMRIGAALSSHPDLTVVGEAADPHEAREAIKALAPDVVTLDVEMPKMSGIEFLEKLMRLRPTPVIMVSSLTGPNCEETLKALELGAIDCVAKPEAGDPAPFGELAEKIRIAAKVRFDHRKTATVPRPAPVAKTPYVSDGRVVAIGSSTGGVEALSAIVSTFPADCPATVVAQHMHPGFTRSFASRLDKLSGARVIEAYDGAVLEKGHVYIAPGGANHLAIIGTARPSCRLFQGDVVSGHRPSVDVMFASLAKTLADRAVGVILTGMGRDGAQGLSAMRQAGAQTIGQDEASSLIYGMPRAAFEAGAVERQLPLERIGPAILSITHLRSDPSPCR